MQIAVLHVQTIWRDGEGQLGRITSLRLDEDYEPIELAIANRCYNTMYLLSVELSGFS